MSYDGKIMRRALARFSEDKQRRQNQADQRRRALFAQEPRLAEIDRELRGTMSRIISSALRRGTDPVPAIRVIRDSGLSHRTTSMFTESEGDWDEVMAVVRDATMALADQGIRTEVGLTADIRPGHTDTLHTKVEKVEELLAE